MKRFQFYISSLAILVFAHAAQAEFTIESSFGLFTPGFRDGTNNDLGNTQ